jgi:hypothetical protein
MSTAAPRRILLVQRGSSSDSYSFILLWHLRFFLIFLFDEFVAEDAAATTTEAMSAPSVRHRHQELRLDQPTNTSSYLYQTALP